MRKTLASILLLALPFVLTAQKKAEHPAEILSYRSCFVMGSPVSGTHEVVMEVQVNNEDGLMAAAFMSADDEFRSLSSFNATVTPLGGGKASKARMSAVEHFSEGGQVDKSIVNYWVPSGQYPFKVLIEYTETYRKGIPSFPVFFPVNENDIPLKEASFTVTVPQGTEIKWYSSAEPVQDKLGKQDVFKWVFEDVPPVVDEPFSPDLRELVPFVFASPVDFAYLGTRGSQRTWADLGRWKRSLFPDMDIPQQLKDEALKATEGFDDLQKLRYVYGWLRERTHYVSIQLGIGGYSPMKPSAVAANGYGDCKALSYFAKSLLEVLGVHSEYFTLSTTRKNMFPGYASLGMMNHAMLCVPLQKDTVWVECTNPALPLGYRHESVAGHEVLLVKDADSELVRVPGYADSLDRSVSVSVLRIAEDGSAVVECRDEMYLFNAEDYINARNWERKKQISMLTKGFRANMEDFRLNGIEDNFNNYDGNPSYVPEITVRYTLTARKYAKTAGDRIFVPVPVFSRGIETKRGERHYPMNIRAGFNFEDEIRMEIPEGWRAESIPAELDMDNEFFGIRCHSVLDGRSLIVRIKSTIKSGTYPKEAYEGFRNLCKSFNKVYDSNVVLVRE